MLNSAEKSFDVKFLEIICSEKKMCIFAAVLELMSKTSFREKWSGSSVG
jgi:hypothetical protein